MVVAAHEVSDGFQRELEETGKGERDMRMSIGKAAEEHPDVAAAVAGSIAAKEPSALVKSILAAGMAALVGIAFWFLLPWFKLLRAVSAMAARRKAKAMRNGDVIDVTPASTCRSGFTLIEVLVLVAAFLALTILGVCRMTAGRDESTSRSSGASPGSGAEQAQSDNADAQAENNARIAKRAAAIAKMQSAYASSLERHYRNFLSDIEHVGSVQFDAVRKGIPRVAERYGTFSRCKDLFKIIVTDRLNGGNETENSIRRDLEADYYRGLYAARDKVHECLKAFVQNVKGANESFRGELEAELATAEFPGDDAYKALMVECGERIEQKKSDLLEGQITAGIALALEAVCIRQTVSAVAGILGKTAVRQAGTMAVGAGAAVADGPLPVGDAIAGVAILGCTAWSLYDIYEATKVLPDELRSTLNSVTSECEKKTLEEVRLAGENIYMHMRVF